MGEAGANGACERVEAGGRDARQGDLWDICARPESGVAAMSGPSFEAFIRSSTTTDCRLSPPQPMEPVRELG